jgi:predicted DCC family thiol-disulfide oxidoreductase YuxK
MNDITKPIVFFDGVCGLCNVFVDLILRYDQKKQFYFAPLQGDTAKSKLNDHFIKDLNTIVLIMPDGQMHTRSEAVSIILKKHPNLKILGNIIQLMPKWFSNFFYNFIAKYRYNIFGKKETCRLPTADETKLFLP